MNESDIFVSCASFDKDDLPKKENNKKDYKNMDTIEEEEISIKRDDNNENKKINQIKEETSLTIEKKEEENKNQIQDNNLEINKNTKNEIKIDSQNNNFIINKQENEKKDNLKNLVIESNNLNTINENKKKKYEFVIQKQINEFIGEKKIKKNDFQIESSSKKFENQKQLDISNNNNIQITKQKEKNDFAILSNNIEINKSEKKKKEKEENKKEITNKTRKEIEKKNIKKKKEDIKKEESEENEEDEEEEEEEDKEEEEEDEFDKKFNNNVKSEGGSDSENEYIGDSIKSKSDIKNEELNQKIKLDNNKSITIINNYYEKDDIDNNNKNKNKDFFLLDPTTYIKIESYNVKNEIIGTYTAFDINIISKTFSPPNNKITKCTRRYDNFHTFYSKLIEKYPYKFLPKLSSKKISLNFIDDKDLLEIRKDELCYLLTYIYSNEDLASLPECINFINSSNFDEMYFKKDKNNNFTSDIQISDYSVGKVFSVFTNYFNEEKQLNKEYDINKIYYFYKGMYDNYHLIKKKINNLRKNKKKFYVNYKALANNFNYIKEVNGIDKNSLTILEKISLDMSEEKDDIDDIFKEFDYFDLLLCGLVELIERYIKFQNLLYNFNESYKKYKNDPKKGREMKSIKESFNEKNKMFFERVQIEIDNFVKKYGKKYQNLMEKFIELIKTENTNNYNIYKSIENN